MITIEGIMRMASEAMDLPHSPDRDPVFPLFLAAMACLLEDMASTLKSVMMEIPRIPVTIVLALMLIRAATEMIRTWKTAATRNKKGIEHLSTILATFAKAN